MEAQPVCACRAAASAVLPRLRSGPGFRTMALLRLRTDVDGCGGGGEPATKLSDSACGGISVIDCHIFSADHRIARRAGQLSELALAIFLRCGVTGGRPMAGIVDDHRRNVHEYRAAEWDNSCIDTNAVRHGGGRIPSGEANRGAPEIWDAVDCDCYLGGYIWRPGPAQPDAVDL